MTDWEKTPEVVLGKVFSCLSLVDKVSVYNTCSSWREALGQTGAWHQFQYSESRVWDEIFEMGIPSSLEDLQQYQEIHQSVLECVERFGRYMRRIYVAIQSTSSFEVYQKIIQNCCNVRKFTLICMCVELSEMELLKCTLREFLQRNNVIRELEIENVDNSGTKNAPLPIGLKQSGCLHSLWIVNSFRSSCLSNLMYLVNLTELAMIPHQLNFSLLKHLASLSLRDLHIVANAQTRGFYNEAISDAQWGEIRKHGPKLRVHCFLATSNEWTEKEVFLKPSMPLASLVYRKNVWIKYLESVCTLMTYHSGTLTTFVDFSLSHQPYNYPVPHCYMDRVDRHIIRLARLCPRLQTLTIKETLSSAAILLMVYLNKNLTDFLVRRDMILYVNDLPEDLESDSVIKQFIADNYERDNFENAVSSLLGTEWHALEVSEFYEIIDFRYSKFS
ncbi:F-box/LRR-repeat protein 21-like [Saccostrea echinata]|uniref:F-box/LRR-repeat protein 21-like n=1 Tax=Saccostrea echinata TaxID=191078 RepID=UPI002A7F3755|nr:F-box/LRR-repeat protein 21-like [Saccostrea echinata]